MVLYQQYVLHPGGSVRTSYKAFCFSFQDVSKAMHFWFEGKVGGLSYGKGPIQQFSLKLKVGVFTGYDTEKALIVGDEGVTMTS